jgi:hypothetical protein
MRCDVKWLYVAVDGLLAGYYKQSALESQYSRGGNHKWSVLGWNLGILLIYDSIQRILVQLPSNHRQIYGFS